MKNYNLTTTFNNLLPMTAYSYRVEAIRANWPVKVSSSGGVFTPTKTSESIDTLITFCPSSGSCSSQNILPYTVQVCSEENVPFVELRLSLDLPYSDQKIYGSSYRFVCEECLQIPEVDLRVVSVSQKPVMVSGTISKLSKNNRYSYNITSLGGSYALSVSELSGMFIAKDNTQSIVFDTSFCCESTCSDIFFPKTKNSTKNNELDHTIKLNVTDLCSNNHSYETIKIVHNIPEPSITTPVELTLNSSTKGCGKLNAVITNIIPNQVYSYQYKVIESNWPVYLDNTSGTILSPSSSGNISSDIVFCPSVAICSSESGVLPATKPYDNKFYSGCGENDYYAVIYIEATGGCYSSTPYINSNPIMVYCRDCVNSPAVKITM